MRFADKSVVILGGSTGIGLETARLFKAEGARVAITARNEDTLRKVADTRSAIEAIAGETGPIDVLCVNAGVGGFATVPEVSESFWDGVHDVNLRGAFFADQSALADGGSIIFTGSIGAQLALPGNATYAAAKAGLRAVARNVGVEPLPRGIRVSMVSPGPTETEIFKRGASEAEIENLRAMMTEAVPMKRMGRAEETAAAIVFLASPEAGFINGVDLYVDGGCIEL
jgi:NAD(P)-dependent dehydrogenase (short-subunit alcohol dehydrogenase family)